MYCLYIDTHYVNLVMALYKDGKFLGKKVLESNEHSRNTINLLNDLLVAYDLTIDDIKEVIVINGPGSFTGVRIGVVIAKIISYTKKIPVKAISYLQAMALNVDKDITVGLNDKNGVFIGKFNKEHELIDDYFYLTNKEAETYSQEIVLDLEPDLQKVYDFLKNKESIDAHLLAPLYIKKIDAEKKCN